VVRHSVITTDVRRWIVTCVHARHRHIYIYIYIHVCYTHPAGGNLQGTRSGSTHPDSTLRTRQRLRPATRDEAPERWSQEGCDVCRYPTCSPLVHECRMVSTYAFRYKLPFVGIRNESRRILATCGRIQVHNTSTASPVR